MSNEPGQSRYRFDPAGARGRAVGFGIPIGLILVGFLYFLSMLPDHLAGFDLSRRDEFIFAMAPVAVVTVLVGIFFWFFGSFLLAPLKLLMSGRISSAAVILDRTGIAIEEAGTTLRFAWRDLVVATSDVAYFAPAKKPGREPIQALVLRHRETGAWREGTTGHEASVAYTYAIDNTPRHLFGAFDFRGLTIVPLELMDQDSAAALCEEAASLCQDANGAKTFTA